MLIRGISQVKNKRKDTGMLLTKKITRLNAIYFRGKGCYGRDGMGGKANKNFKRNRRLKLKKVASK